MKIDSIYKTAKDLINLHNDAAEEYASFTMQKLMFEDDAKGAAIWFGILAAIEDLRKINKQKYLN